MRQALSADDLTRFLDAMRQLHGDDFAVEFSEGLKTSQPPMDPTRTMRVSNRLLALAREAPGLADATKEGP